VDLDTVKSKASDPHTSFSGTGSSYFWEWGMGIQILVK